MYEHTSDNPPNPCCWFVVRQSGIHGKGAFAIREIPVGTYVAEYVGERISKSESIRRCEANNNYIFTVNELWDLDGDVEWNPARFLNHCCTPNCDAEMDEDERIWIVSRHTIKCGEELTFNYNYDLDEYHDHPCQCGSPDCVGYIVAEQYFDHVRRRHGWESVS